MTEESRPALKPPPVHRTLPGSLVQEGVMRDRTGLAGPCGLGSLLRLRAVAGLLPRHGQQGHGPLPLSGVRVVASPEPPQPVEPAIEARREW